MSSPPGVRTPPCASLARAHAALGNFATTSPRVSARGAGNTRRYGDHRLRGPEVPSSSSPPGRGTAFLAPAVPARAPGCPRCQGGRSTRFPPTSPHPHPHPRCLKRTKRVSLVGTRPVQCWAAGAGGRRWHPEKRVPGRRGRRPGLLREDERAPASASVGACAPRPARPSPRAAATPQRQDPGRPAPTSGRSGLLTCGQAGHLYGPLTQPGISASRGPGARPRLKLGSLVLGRESRTHRNRPQRENSPHPPPSGTFSSLFNYDDFQNSPFRRSLPSPQDKPFLVSSGICLENNEKLVLRDNSLLPPFKKYLLQGKSRKMFSNF